MYIKILVYIYIYIINILSKLVAIFFFSSNVTLIFLGNIFIFLAVLLRVSKRVDLQYVRRNAPFYTTRRNNPLDYIMDKNVFLFFERLSYMQKYKNCHEFLSK